MHLSHSPENPSSALITFDQFVAVDIRIGTIVEAAPFPEARKPSLKLLIDFGPAIGRKKSSAQISHYNTEDLVGRQVAAVVNFLRDKLGSLCLKC